MCLLENIAPRDQKYDVLREESMIKIFKKKNYLLECRIPTGCGAGETVLILRILMMPTIRPLRFRQLRLPVKDI